MPGGELHPGEEQAHDSPLDRDLTEFERRAIPDGLDRLRQNCVARHATSIKKG
jgi:hypothetical protein